MDCSFILIEKWRSYDDIEAMFLFNALVSTVYHCARVHHNPQATGRKLNRIGLVISLIGRGN